MLAICQRARRRPWFLSTTTEFGLGVRTDLSSRLARQALQNSSEQIIADEPRVDVHFDGQAVGKRQHHCHDIVDTEVAWDWICPEDLNDAVSYRLAQVSAVSEELGTHFIVSNGALPEVQEDQLPFPLLDEGFGEATSDVLQCPASWRASWIGSQDRPNGFDPGQDLVGHHGEEEFILARKIRVDGTFREVCGGCDLIETCTGKAVLGEYLQRRVQQAATYILTPRSSDSSNRCCVRALRVHSPTGCPALDIAHLLQDTREYSIPTGIRSE